jgi:hypothetical protein
LVSSKQEIWWEENDTFPRRLAVGKFVDDTPVGEIKMYDEQRRLMATYHFKDGQLHGLCTTYYPNGKKLQEAEFVNGKREGTDRAWFDNGQLAQTLECRNGVSHGAQVMYYKDGSKFCEGESVNGVGEGELKGYLPGGRLANVSMRAKGEIVSDKDQFQLKPEEMEIINERAKFALSVKAHWAGSSSSGDQVADRGESPGFVPQPPSGGSSQQSCSNCFGTGQANCGQCFGTGKRTCFNCNGTGRTFNNVQCFQCYGTGQQNCSYCQYGKVQCPVCFGSGRR